MDSPTLNLAITETMDQPLSSDPPLSWPGLASINLLQAVSGTRTIFTAYSASVAKRFGISQTQLNYLLVALDTGRVMGWFPNTAAKHLPLWTILLIGLIFGSVGYGVQYLCAIEKIHYLSYWQLFFLNVLAGNSSCWINTYCELKTTRGNSCKAIAAVTSSYSGLSGKIYTSLVEGIQWRKDSDSPSTYLLLNCIVQTTVGLAVALLISCPKIVGHQKVHSFLLAFLFAFVSGAYSVCDSMIPAFKHISPDVRAVLLLLVVMLPLLVPLVQTAYQFTSEQWNSQAMPEASNIASKASLRKDANVSIGENEPEGETATVDAMNVGEEVEQEVDVKVGKVHQLKELLMSANFWLFFWVNASGSTLAMVYLNNLGRISESRGKNGGSLLLAMSSAFGFFGRLLCVILGWYTREKRIVSRPTALMTMMIPISASFFLLISENDLCLHVSTGILGACSGALTATTAITTSELFGLKHSQANYDIILTNIPVGSLLFGYLAALNYNRNGGGKYGICTGFECHRRTFIIWGSICSIGTILSFILHLRTQKLYMR